MELRLLKSKLFKRVSATYQRALHNPAKVQEDLLKHILHHNRETAYGRKYGFAAIKSIEEFQEKVPVVTYDDLFPYVECMLQGMRNVLVKDKVVFFATTSGTTSKPKLIPVTNVRKQQLQQELLLWLSFMAKRGLLKGIRGKTLYFAGPFREEVSMGGTLMGSISGYMAWKSPVWAKSKLVVPPEFYNEMDFDKKTRMIALKALATRNITQIGFAAPIEAILFFDYVKKHKRSLLKELERLGKNHRVRQLAKLTDFSPGRIWPRLSLINCIKSETNMPYLEVVEEKVGLPGLVIRDPGIFASEGRLTLGITDHDRAGVLVAQENFFEFMELAGEVYKAPVTIEKVKRGRKYKVILTTQEGLYRYDIGDVVEVVDFKGKLPVVRFVQRDNFLNIVGEFSPENQLLAAMDAVAGRLGVSYEGYTFIPYTRDLERRPCYEVLLEPKGDLDDEEVRRLMRELDKELVSRIQDYRQMRQEFGRLGHLRVSLVRRGSYELLAREQLSRSGQPKPVRVAKDASFRDRFAIEKEFFAG
ncbi:GH3 auxin-responsive promoter family protein [Candidatus Woesearchaeota archaeon]|nr:GH3 auxin-responsive promoter family protein [Candidatus Woesearchaeota archaeon]